MNTLDDLIDHWEEQRDLGIHLSPEQLCVECPHLLDEVRSQIEALRQFDCLFGGDIAENSTPGPIDAKLLTPPSHIRTSSRYRLQGCHAVGGLGQVYLAYDEILDRRVAIKFPRLQGMSAKQIARFELEARITSQLDHPGIVPIHTMDSTTNGEPCYVMRFVDGKTLQQAVEYSLREKFGSQSNYYRSEELRQLLKAFVTVCNIVAFAHDQGILHRDIKPNNILLGSYGETLLLDWGIAKQLRNSADEVREDLPQRHPDADPSDHLATPATMLTQLTVVGNTPGTPGYASPEQLNGDSLAIGTASDVYSLGATLFFILAGKAPMELAGLSAYLDHIKQPKQPLTNLLSTRVPHSLRAICCKALEVEPSQRYASPLQLAADIENYLAGQPLSVYRDPWWVQLHRWTREHPRLTGAVLASAVVITLAGYITSGLVTAKNRQLSSGNEKLALALGNAEDINKVAINALQEMSGNVVANRLARNSELSQADKEYINAILQSYQALANLQPNSESAMALRADAQSMIGQLYYELNQRQESRHHLMVASEQFQSLIERFGRKEYRLERAQVLERVAALDFEAGRFEDSWKVALQGLESLGDTRVDANEQISDSWVSCLINLKLLVAESLHYLRNDVDALAQFLSAIPLMEQLLLKKPLDVGIRFNAGSKFRAFASFLNEQESDEHNRQTALDFANRAVSLLNNAVEARPDVNQYLSSLAWAHYDRANIYQSLGDFDHTVDDFTASLAIIQKLSARFPLIRDYSDRVIIGLYRRTRAHQKAGSRGAVDQDSRAAIELLGKRMRDSSRSLIKPSDMANWMLELGEMRLSFGDYQSADQAVIEVEQFLMQDRFDNEDTAVSSIRQRIKSLIADIEKHTQAADK